MRQAGGLHQRKAIDAVCELRILHGILAGAERMARLAGEMGGIRLKPGNDGNRYVPKLRGHQIWMPCRKMNLTPFLSGVRFDERCHPPIYRCEHS